MAMTTFWLGDYASVAAHAGEGLALARELGDTWCIACSLRLLGSAALGQGESERAAPLYDESLALSRKLGHNHLIATGLLCRGNAAYAQRDYALATVLLEESLARYRQAGNKTMILHPLAWLGTLALNQSDYERAKSLWEEGLRTGRAVGHQRGVAGCLECLARLRKAEGRARRAVRLMAAAEGLRTAISTPEALIWHAEYQRDVAETRAQLGEEAFAAAWAEGQALTWQQAVAEALEEEV
jgi:ATP/maltotriose-dependent transcriptional regulator MalT